jgi:hypothetical protein
VPRPLAAIIAAAVLLGLLCLAVFAVHSSGDYNVSAPVGGDNAGPGLVALLHGSIRGYVEHQPVIGLPSILLRFPLVALASALGASTLQVYLAGALACLLPLALFGAWLVTQPGLSTEQRLTRFLAIALVIQSPIIHNGLSSGHPEGVLSTLLGVVAVLAAMRGRVVWAAVLLGLAISSKETGMIALLPVLVAVPGQRRKVAAIAAGVVFLMCGTMWLADPDAFLRTLHGEGATRFLTPLSLLWPFSAPVHLGATLSVARVIPLGLSRTQASALMLFVVGTVFAVWFTRAWRRGATPNPLVLLVLMGLLRCVCDSTHEAYYWITLLIPLAAWEAFSDRVPFKTLLLNLSVLILFAALGRIGPAYLYTVSTSGEILLALYLARQAMVFASDRSTAGASLYAPGAPHLALAGGFAGRSHEFAMVNSSDPGQRPMTPACDARSTSS